MPTAIELVWLFDVDGTLLLTDGAGRDALARTLAARLGIHDPLEGIPFAGRTDRLIFGDIAQRHGIQLDPAEYETFWADVAECLGRLMTPPRGGLLPGVRVLLDAVGAEPRWVSALLTGNMPAMARIKLEAFGVARHFAFGTYGDEGPDRNAIACLAVRRAAERHGVPPGRCVVVGDTEHDVACARAAGARAVAVATGGRSRDVLHAAGPDLLLDDLSDPEPLLRWARALGG